MKNNMIKTEINVNGNKVGLLQVGDIEYISLTDLARYADPYEPRFPIQYWMRGKDVVAYLGLWETINNNLFNRVEFDTVKNEAGSNKFRITPKRWIETTNAIGIISRMGKYNSGTYAHPDIAFEFASWLSPEFKLYLITEFQRLKRKELEKYNLDWKANRILTKLNYLIHTDAVKDYIVPTLTSEQKKYVYADEADVINVALFGMTAKEWRDTNPDLDGNIRDNADLLHLVILNNLEISNSEFIKLGLKQSERLIRLNESARKQIETLKNSKNIEELKLLENKTYILN